jgi:hypothetical protein
VSQDQADGSCEITSMNKTQADGSYGVGGAGGLGGSWLTTLGANRS